MHDHLTSNILVTYICSKQGKIYVIDIWQIYLTLMIAVGKQCSVVQLFTCSVGIPLILPKSLSKSRKNNQNHIKHTSHNTISNDSNICISDITPYWTLLINCTRHICCQPCCFCDTQYKWITAKYISNFNYCCYCCGF